MNRRSAVLAAAFLGAATILVVIGAGLRPLVIDEDPRSDAVLSDTEIGFAQDMLAHHTQALTMVSLLDPSGDPAVRALAQQIEQEQRVETGQLIGWLRLAGASLVNPTPMAWMHDIPAGSAHDHAGSTPNPSVVDSDPEHAGLMPGAASQRELDDLAATRGRDNSTMFLQLMQRHHYGGIDMAQAAMALLDGGVVAQTAREMAGVQGQEAGVMGLLLAR